MDKKKSAKKEKTKITSKVNKETAVEATLVKPVSSNKKVVITAPVINSDSLKTGYANFTTFVKKNGKVFSIFGYVLIAVAAFALVDLLVQYLNNDYSIAVIDGTRVSRAEYNKRLEQVSGQKVSTQLIEETIFRREAAAKGITVTSSEIDTVVKQYEDYLGGKDALDKALKDTASTRADIRYSIESDLLAKKVVTQNTTVSDSDLKAFYDKFGSQMFPSEVTKDSSGNDVLPSFDSKKTEIKDVYMNQQYLQNKDSWLATKKASIAIQNNFDAKPTYGLFKATINLVEGLKKAAK